MNKIFLIIGQILLGIQWLRMTFAFIGLLTLNHKEIVINQLEIYYLVMIGFLICSGFLYLKQPPKLEIKMIEDYLMYGGAVLMLIYAVIKLL